MELYNRRLLLLNGDEPSYSDVSPPQRLTAGPLSSSLYVTPLKLSATAPFNSDVACIFIIVLLSIAVIVLFIRRFADHFSASAHLWPPASSNYHSPSSSCSCIDRATVQSLPVFQYKAEAEHQDDCAICLSEFEIGKTIKMIPNCKHVFHGECIDTWLSSHVTCPICRGSKFFAVERRAESAKVEHTSNQTVRRQQVASMVENSATWREGRVVGTCNQRRSRSCSSFRDTVVLRRTVSY